MTLPIFNLNAPRRLPQQPNPNAVRDYIRQTLITRLDTTSTFADEVAAKWPVRRSYELYAASSENLGKVFGQELGPVLHRIVQDDIREDWWNSYDALLRSGFLAISVTLSIYFFVCACRGSTLREARCAFIGAIAWADSLAERQEKQRS
ncbi:hypothetical protein PFICI_04330 [Pestalotiopsis fici W106-1]|uniref:Uncharacterized protein n=1 Tax=Pestalotiopsis fici (strain W106-1 / CGMCC3.15140) TaxID=1229662 RepID=W3X8V0_PESFW|nr:uncharacterized protein PFICI_04330 [Pestalotiopsis fici W106-1]ETS82454.1 hypothetical protein PFICI_04330 [Pestalotiopsis fici W106-1]